MESLASGVATPGQPCRRRSGSLGCADDDVGLIGPRVTEGAAGAFLDPRNRRRFSAQTRRHSRSSAICPKVTFRQRSSSAASGLVVRDAKDPGGGPSSSPRSWMAQAAITRTGAATAAVTNMTRLNPPCPLIGETSARLRVDSLGRVRESDEVAPCPDPGRRRAGQFRELAPVPARQPLRSNRRAAAPAGARS